MSMKSIITKGRAFDKAVGKTVVESARDVALEIWNTYGADITNEQCQEIGDGIGGEVGSRVSEWKKFAMAVPFGMAEAVAAMPAELLTRSRLFQLARRVYKAADYTHVKSTVSAYVDEIKSGKKASKGSGNHASIASHVKGIFNVQDRSKQAREFRKDFAKLCKKHGYEF